MRSESSSPGSRVGFRKDQETDALQAEADQAPRPGRIAPPVERMCFICPNLRVHRQRPGEEDGEAGAWRRG